MRPGRNEPWTSDEEKRQTITINVSPQTEDPAYIELIEFVILENVGEIQIELLKTLGDKPAAVKTVKVSYKMDKQFDL